ncbi:cation diffusion facilitator family transporter [Brachyspira sp. CAG:700]|nr:cation diffusion facilitator family transporter [Brachyspira sp. CAG:700]
MNKNEIKSKYMIIEGIVSVIVNILLFAFKYAVGIFSGSLSIIADAWHSLSDSISSIIVIIGGIFSKKPSGRLAFFKRFYKQHNCNNRRNIFKKAR